jgi:hypothetical protein
MPGREPGSEQEELSMGIGSLVGRVAVAGAVTTAITLVAAPAASAQSTSPAPAPVTITLSPEQVDRICNERLPRVQARVNKSIERINGGVDVVGSAAWLRARAQKQREAGREQLATQLEQRAERRLGHIDKLNRANQRIADVQAKHCQSVGGAK